jgi:hypothetical protein
MNPIIDRMNDLVAESTKNTLDAAFLAQSQSAQFAQTWLNTLTANQESTRAIATKMVRDAQQAQSLWLQLGQEIVRANTEAWNTAHEIQTRTVNAAVDTANRGARNGTKIETPAK